MRDGVSREKWDLELYFAEEIEGEEFCSDRDGGRAFLLKIIVKEDLQSSQKGRIGNLATLKSMLLRKT
jgi:hypothetical protein